MRSSLGAALFPIYRPKSLSEVARRTVLAMEIYVDINLKTKRYQIRDLNFTP